MARHRRSHDIEIWELRRGAEVLARLELTGERGFPWIFAHIFPTAAFEPLRELFREQPDAEGSKVVREQLREWQIVLCQPPPHPKPRDFTLIVDGDQARFKCVFE